MKIIDISAPVPGCRVYPGDPSPSLTKVRTVAADGCDLSVLSMCVHNGTHVDAPAHFVPGGSGADDIALEKCIGRCAVTDSAEKALELAAAGETRILLKGCDVTAEQARSLAGHIVLLGTDGLSFGECADEQEAVHKVLLGFGVVLLEGLVLDDVRNGVYALSALPLKLRGSDGSPVRAVLVE